MSKKKIVCYHLLNDYSGSPNVLRTAIIAFLEEGYEVDLIVNKETIGFLNDLKVNYRFVSYNFNKNFFLTSLRLLWYQIQIFFKALSYNKVDSIFIINTIYPCSAALAAKFLGIKVFYYIHESRLESSLIKNIFFWLSKNISDCNIFVSEFIKKQDSSKTKKEILYNSLSPEFFYKPSHYLIKENNLDTFNVIFLSSFKMFKGVNTLIDLANNFKNTPKVKFFIMLNGEKKEIENFREDNKNSTNVVFLSNLEYSIHDIYRKGDVLLNLTIPKYCIETFGLTILEGFSYGIPAIVPNIGGPTEIVDNEVNGFCVNVENVKEIEGKILTFLNDRALHIEFKKQARLKSCQFSYKAYKNSLLKIINS